MFSMCKNRGQQIVKDLYKPVSISTQSTSINMVAPIIPQKKVALHNFTTQYSTHKNTIFTEVIAKYSTVSTKPITTTTIYIKER